MRYTYDQLAGSPAATAATSAHYREAPTGPLGPAYLNLPGNQSAQIGIELTRSSRAPVDLCDMFFGSHGPHGGRYNTMHDGHHSN
ncbi:uncharacterized protein N7483_012317 [Penicillium malachiteum]|uniref:uncharacterized protein n=1 Tax=Penicillium malachiteum TaxID=1324776 RepID=UPI00254699F2|nr:uncharacterized protein N7483_012317 [Penicillium malachiteum]KAJ5715136.1 hypothetical protein N7483_012317 [Penicillium malachiteum]